MKLVYEMKSSNLNENELSKKYKLSCFVIM